MEKIKTEETSPKPMGTFLSLCHVILREEKTKNKKHSHYYKRDFLASRIESEDLENQL